MRERRNSLPIPGRLSPFIQAMTWRKSLCRQLLRASQPVQARAALHDLLLTLWISYIKNLVTC